MSDPNKWYREPRYVSDGDTVWIAWDREKGTALRCMVACAAGHHARVVNQDYGVDKWLPLTHLLVPPDDDRAYPLPTGLV